MTLLDKAPPAAPTPVRRRGRLGTRRIEPWVFIAPAAVVLVALLGYPLYQLVLISFYDYNQAQVSGGAPLVFTGLENYTALLSSQQFWRVTANTVGFAASCVLATLVVGGALAVLATRLRPWVRKVLFTISLGAWATPAITGSAVWLFLFDPTLGLVNHALAGLGLDSFAGHSWTYERLSAFALVGSEVVWCSFPFAMVTIYAGLLAIPQDILEAARLDGADTGRLVRSIMAPLLRPVLIIVTIQSIIWDVKIFTQIYVMTGGGGIGGQNLTLNVFSYQEAFASNRYGAGAAIGVIMTVILLAITVVYLRVLRRGGEVL